MGPFCMGLCGLVGGPHRIRVSRRFAAAFTKNVKSSIYCPPRSAPRGITGLPEQDLLPSKLNER
jgi:hypothetical protein